MAFLYRLLPPRPTFAQDMSPDEAAIRDLGKSDPAVQTGTCTYKAVPMQLVH